MLIFDIGANAGLYTFPWLQDGHKVYAFEPLPYRYDFLKSKEKEFPNLKVFNFAIGLESGTKEFYINDPDVTSSLKKFNDTNLILYPEISKNTEIIKVECIKAAEFIRKNELIGKTIDLVKIDTQGAEFEVIKSFEEFVKNIREIRCEAFLTTKDKDLYENEGKAGEIINYLEDLGFYLVGEEIEQNSRWCDMVFKNSKFD